MARVIELEQILAGVSLVRLLELGGYSGESISQVISETIVNRQIQHCETRIKGCEEQMRRHRETIVALKSMKSNRPEKKTVADAILDDEWPKDKLPETAWRE